MKGSITVKLLGQFATALGVVGLIVWGLAKLTTAPLTPVQMGEYASAATPKSLSTAGQQELLKDEIKKALKFQYDWTTSGFGTVMMADITITNPTPHSVKDVEIRCSTFGASGTKLGALRQTIYELVKPKSTKKVKRVNMGFIHSQTDKVGCIISDLVILPS
jgi:hypothetical protein